MVNVTPIQQVDRPKTSKLTESPLFLSKGDIAVRLSQRVIVRDRFNSTLPKNIKKIDMNLLA